MIFAARDHERQAIWQDNDRFAGKGQVVEESRKQDAGAIRRMNGARIATRRRVKYAKGYVALGLLNEASDELEAIDFGDRFLPEVVSARIDLHMEAKHWETVIGFARDLARGRPDDEKGWISWAYALKELGRTAEAKAVLCEAEPLHGETSSNLH